MRFTKPAWVAHTDSSAPDGSSTATKPLTIFSLHVHPDDSRIATGGLDAKVRIWSTAPIVSSEADEGGKIPKSLATLGMHTGPVLCVRWAHSGRWLASGSDDSIILIWDLDPNGSGKIWGSDEVNVEGWKALKRLPGHESDVTGLSWSPGDRYLASTGLDSMVMIWDGYTLDRIRKLDLHKGFVKGVCWDPVGEFLATCSDDKTVKFWRTRDWGLEVTISKPFEDSPGNTFFRRLSWSPDGAHITVANACNGKGMVFVAAVIARSTWTSEISLVGHEHTVQAVAYNPHIFLRDKSQPVQTQNLCSVVALGGDDCSVSVWQTKSARPLIVAKEAFARGILDLSWSWDGLTLYACSSDGTVAAFAFTQEEMDGILPVTAQEKYLQKFGFMDPNRFCLAPSALASQGHVVPTNGSTAVPSVGTTPFGQTVMKEEKVTQLVARKGKAKKRVNLESNEGVTTNGFENPTPTPTTTTTTTTTMAPITIPQPPLSSIQPAVIDLTSTGDMADILMGDDVPMVDALNTPIARNGKTKAGDGGEKAGKARTLGGDRVREDMGPVRVLAGGQEGAKVESVGGGHLLNAPDVKSFISARIEGTEDVLEGTNDDGGMPTEVTFSTGKQVHFLDYLSSRVLLLALTPHLCAVALEDGSVTVYSHTGRRLMPTMTSSSRCAFLEGSKTHLMAITTSGQLYLWNVRTQRASFPPTSIHPLLVNPNTTITFASLRPNGSPIVHLSNGTCHSYDPHLLSFVRLSDSWWASGSDAWTTRQRTSTTGVGPVIQIENSISELRMENQDSGDIQRPSWWSAAMTLGHLETRLQAARVLESPAEYKQALLVYAKKIADEAFRAKAEEMIKELCGPIYWRHGREETWAPTVCGFAKRDLLKDVLTIFARSKTLTKLALDWQDTLRKAAADDS